MTFSLRQLRYFTALADTLHFGKAAEQCFVTQSTLSAGIRDLEEALGARLAERTKRRVVLTPLGQEVCIRAQALLRDAEDIKSLTARYRKPLSGALRLGVIPTIAPYLLPHALPGIRAAHPDLDLILIEDQTERLLQALRDGRVDVVLMALPWPSAEFTSLTLFSDPFQLACARAHPLAKYKQVGSDDFADEPLLLLADGHCLREHALSACSFKGHRGQRGMEGASLMTLTQMVAGGLGITLLPQMAIDAGLARLSDLAIIPLEPGSNARDIGLLWRKTSGRDEEFEKLGTFFSPAL
ncbi:MAG: LysR family transcriptional regulator [Robiginitomaculum sp.]|nr:MAG: LysR family transcriptional regulator [Robiginitomaculum sp.]